MERPNKVLDFLQSQINIEGYPSPSPLGKWLGGTIRRAQMGALEIDFVVRQEMTNPFGSLHGGIIASIIDDTMGMTVSTLKFDHFFSTVNLVIDYLSAGRVGNVVTVKSKVIREGKNIVNVACVLTGNENVIIARGTSNLIKTSIPKPV